MTHPQAAPAGPPRSVPSEPLAVHDRAELLSRAIARIGAVSREFNAHATYPFIAQGLGRAPMNVLYTLAQGDGTSVAELARVLRVTSGAVSQTVDALKAAGLVTSAVNPADRRGRIIRLTPRARDEVDRFQQRFFEVAAPRFDRLSPAEIIELDRLLGLIRTGADPR